MRAKKEAGLVTEIPNTIAQAEYDRIWVKRAQLGDTEAFSELIEQHRSTAHRWADRMTGDPHLADDVVQDALICAFLHLGSLEDTSRFLPWFYRIVINQASMRLRRGGPYRQERPFTSIGAAMDDGSTARGYIWAGLGSRQNQRIRG